MEYLQGPVSSANLTREFLPFGLILIYDGSHFGTSVLMDGDIKCATACIPETWQRLFGSKCNRLIDKSSASKTWPAASVPPCHWLS